MHNSSERVVPASKQQQQKTEPRVKLLMAINVKECTAHILPTLCTFFNIFFDFNALIIFNRMFFAAAICAEGN